MDELDELLAAAARADGQHRIEFRNPIAAFGAEAIMRLRPWLTDQTLGAFAVLTIMAASVHDAIDEARQVLADAMPNLTGPVRGDAEAALRRLGPAARRRRQNEVSGSPVAALGELRRLLAEWEAEGRPPQPAVEWQQASWITEFPDHARALRKLPARLDRRAVRQVAQHASQSEAEAELALLVSSGWGYRDIGYGWFRLGVGFGMTEDAGARLLHTARILAAKGAVAAYRELGGNSRVFNVGPAFGTKFLFFCQDPAARPRALILDKNVTDWLRGHAGLDLNPLPWSPKTYETYLDQMHRWADALDVEPEVVELVMFREAVGPDSPWR